MPSLNDWIGGWLPSQSMPSRPTQSEPARSESSLSEFSLPQPTEESETDQMRVEIEHLQQQNREMTEKVGIFQLEREALLDEGRAVCEERDLALGQQESLHSQISMKDDNIRELQREILHYKKSVAGSTRLERQLSDTTIQQSMDGLFYAVRDWALEVARQNKAILKSVNKDTSEWLHKQVPGGKEGSSTRIVNALIALFCNSLCLSTKQGWVFGVGSLPSDGGKCQVTHANSLYNFIGKIEGVTVERKKQWVLLTNELLSKDEKTVQQALSRYSKAIGSNMCSKFTDASEASAAIQKLQSIIQPHLQIVQAFYHQESDYSLTLPAVINATGARYKLNSDCMEDVNGEDEGMLQACIFPILYKHDYIDAINTKTTVICKAKVMLE